MTVVIVWVCRILATALAVALAIKLGKNLFAPTVVANAKVVNKQTVETFSKYAGTSKHTKYAVTFSVNGKNRSFYVSAFSYNGYKKGDTGVLTYKGDKLISFT